MSRRFVVRYSFIKHERITVKADDEGEAFIFADQLLNEDGLQIESVTELDENGLEIEPETAIDDDSLQADFWKKFE